MKCLYSSGGRPCQLDEHETGDHDYKVVFPSLLDAVHARIDDLERVVSELRAAVIVSPAGFGGPLPMLELDGAAPSPGVAPAGPLRAEALSEAVPLSGAPIAGRRVVVELDVGGAFLGEVLEQLGDGRVRVRIARLGEQLVRPGKCLLVPEGWGA